MFNPGKRNVPRFLTEAWMDCGRRLWLIAPKTCPICWVSHMFSIWKHRYSYGICFGSVCALQNSTPNISTPNILSFCFLSTPEELKKCIFYVGAHDYIILYTYIYIYTGPLNWCTRTPSKQVSIHFFNGLCCQSAGRPGTRGVWQWENQGNCEESWLMKPQNVLIGIGNGRTEAISRGCLGLLTTSSRGVPILRVIDEWFFGVRYWPWLIARVYKSRVDVRMQMGEINVRQSETSRIYLPWGKPQEHVRLAWNMTLWFVKCETFSKQNHFLSGA